MRALRMQQPCERQLRPKEKCCSVMGMKLPKFNLRYGDSAVAGDGYKLHRAGSHAFHAAIELTAQWVIGAEAEGECALGEQTWI